MASSSFCFDRAIAYALLCLKQEGLLLKDKQSMAVKLLSDGKDVFVWFPTGYGKSICYQLLPFVFDYKLGKTDAPLVERSVVLILSPLVSLMVDQVRSLRSQGVSAAILNSSNKGLDQSLVASDTGICQGKYRLLYAAPEAVVEDHKWRMLLLAPPTTISAKLQNCSFTSMVTVWCLATVVLTTTYRYS